MKTFRIRDIHTTVYVYEVQAEDEDQAWEKFENMTDDVARCPEYDTASHDTTEYEEI